MREQEQDLQDAAEETPQPRGPWRFFASTLSARPPQPRPNTMLRDLFGRGRRDHTRADTGRAAEELGVSQRTVERWIQKKKIPAAREQEIRQRWEESPAGRKRRIDPAAQRLFVSGQPIACTVEADVTISNDRRNGTPRAFTLVFGADEAQGIMQSMIQGDEDEAERVWDQVVERGFGGSVDMDIKRTNWQAEKRRR